MSDNRLIEKLSMFLADTYTLYLKTQNFHWNVTGPLFHSMHTMFEAQYNDLALAVDEIAERILTLGGTPLHAYSDFTQHTSISEDKNVKDGTSCVKGVVTGLQALIAEQRQVSALAEESEDQGSADLVDAYVQEQEKLVWMYNAFLG